MFDQLPLSGLLSGAAIVLLVTFFVTSGDSATLVLADMSGDASGEPPLSRRMVWGALLAATAMALLLSGGIGALQAAVIVAALPFVLLLAATAVSLYRVLDAEYRRDQREQRALYHEQIRWLAEERARMEVDRGAATAPDPEPAADSGRAPDQSGS